MYEAKLQQKEHTCQEILYTVYVNSFDPVAFAAWLEDAFQHSNFKSYSQLADKIGVTRSTISSLATARVQSATGKASQPRAEMVINLANALGVDADTALLKAGHAPKGNPESLDLDVHPDLRVSHYHGKSLTPREKEIVEQSLAVAFAIAKETLIRERTATADLTVGKREEKEE